MAIELWDDESRNAVADFDTEAETLSYVREMIEEHGERSVARWALEVDDAKPVIRGERLLQMAMAVPA